MDHTVARKRQNNARVHQCLPYIAHQDRYQIFRETSSSQVSRCSAYIHLDRNGFSGHLILGHNLPICRQNRAEDQTKYAPIWVWESLTAKARKGWPQPIEQRTDKRWIVLGQLVQDASKEGHSSDKERYQELV